MKRMTREEALASLAGVYAEMNEEIIRLETALKQIAELPYFYEETAWTWSDISKKQTDIARAALGLQGPTTEIPSPT